MNGVDVFIIGFTLLMAVWGYYQGLVVGGLSLIGFASGAVIGSRVAPLVLEDGARSPYAPLLTLAGAILIGGVLATLGEFLGVRLRQRLGAAIGVADGLAGAALVGCVGLALCWIAGAVTLHTPELGGLRADVQRSSILGTLNGVLPPSNKVLNTLARLDPIPHISGPSPKVAPPTGEIATDRDVIAAHRSTVRVIGTACGLSVQGSGWIAGDGVVVTNAHVVAGSDDTAVQLGGEGAPHDADVIWFEPRNDLAILYSSGIEGAPALELVGNPEPGTPAAVVGYPNNGPYEIEQGRLGVTETVQSQDSYGRGPITREITSLRGAVRVGGSGGAALDKRGDVLTTIFASAENTPYHAGFGVPNSIVERALGQADPGRVVDPGRCVG